MRTPIFLLFFLALSMGCSKKVEFTRSGTPICPYCKAVVKPHTEYCEQCKNSFRWADSIKICWACDGSKLCPSCKGSGQIASLEDSREKCTYCNGSGRCPECDSGAGVEFGNAPLKTYIHRE